MRTIRSSVNLRRVGQIGVDVGLIALAYYLSYVLRFDEGIPHRYEDLLQNTIVFVVAMKLVVFALFGLYSKLWRFVDQKDVEAIVKAVVVATVVLIAALFLLSLGSRRPAARGDRTRLPAHAGVHHRLALPLARPGGAPASRPARSSAPPARC